MVRRFSLYMVFFIIGIFLFMACNNKADQDGLTIGVMSSTDLLPYAIAQRNGYFENYGVNVTIQKFYSANDRDASFQTKTVDGTITDLTGAIIQRANGIDAVITSKEFGVFHVMTHDSTIHTMAGLKGKNVASSKNTVIDFVIDMALNSAGLTPDDIVRQEVNKIPIRLEMLRNYKTDATGLPEPFISIALEDGMKSVVSLNELGYNVTCMFFHQSVINEKKDLLKSFYQAYNEAVNYIHTHPRHEYTDVLIKDLGVPEHLVSKVLLPGYQKAALPTSRDINAVIQWLKEKSLIPADYQPDHLLNDTFLQED
ncbi:MAG: ABC transporter substrate-binding protein [Bacteroidales bacterium]|nr:ABC transporter substrate-binding protein [Bacteroidales bacterium]